MSTRWTPEELKEFSKLVDMSGSSDQIDRINARIEMPEFVKLHGDDKCKAMWAHLNSPKPKGRAK